MLGISDRYQQDAPFSSLLGQASLEPSRAVEAGSRGTWRVVYSVGEAGVDDGGRVRLCFRINSDWGVPQFDRPSEANYVTASTTGSARLTLAYHPRGHRRPWSKALTVLVDDGYLRAGDTVTITLGDTTAGGAGFESQPYAEQNATFALFVDAGGTGAYLPVGLSGGIDLLGGAPAAVDIVLPADVVVNEAFHVGVAIRDDWGNPAGGRHEVVLDAPGVSGLPARLEVAGALTLDNVTADEPGILRIGARLIGNAEIKGVSNPTMVHADPPPIRRWWGDLHGQSSETCGTGPADRYLAYARDAAFLDFAGHQGNDFELTDGNWATVTAILNRFNQPGRFVTFVGYEWSGNTGAGGDHNVMFRGDGGPIHRSGLWLLDPADAADAVCPTIRRLQDVLRGRDDVMLVPHVGGRFADVATIDPELTPLVEIWSTHGEFEWLFDDAVALGHRVAVSCGSDDHTGRLGATRPGRNAFAVRGGLLCLSAEALTRDALWQAMWSGRSYGTTGERILLSVSAAGATPGGDLPSASQPVFDIEAHGTKSIARIELRRGMGEIVAVHQADTLVSGGVRVSWRGARNRGREREAGWDGHLVARGTEIDSAAAFSFDRRCEGVEHRNAREVAWRSTTAGDTDGVDLQLTDGDNGFLDITTPSVVTTVDLAQLGTDPVVHTAGGLGLELRVERLRPALGLDVACKLSTQPPDALLTPFVVVVHQTDGSKAWSSPVWVDRR